MQGFWRWPHSIFLSTGQKLFCDATDIPLLDVGWLTPITFGSSMMLHLFNIFAVARKIFLWCKVKSSFVLNDSDIQKWIVCIPTRLFTWDNNNKDIVRNRLHGYQCKCSHEMSFRQCRRPPVWTSPKCSLQTFNYKDKKERNKKFPQHVDLKWLTDTSIIFWMKNTFFQNIETVKYSGCTEICTFQLIFDLLVLRTANESDTTVCCTFCLFTEKDERRAFWDTALLLLPCFLLSVWA